MERVLLTQSSSGVLSPSITEKAVYDMNVEKDNTGPTSEQTIHEAVQSVFVIKDWVKYNYIYRSTQSVGLAVFERVKDVMEKYNEELIVNQQRSSVNVNLCDRFEKNMRYVKLGVESEDESTAHLFWRLVNTLFELNRVKSLEEECDAVLDLMEKVDLREVHKIMPLMFRNLLCQPKDCVLEHDYIIHLNPKSCNYKGYTDNTFKTRTCYFLEATDRVTKERHAVVSVEFVCPKLIFLGRVVESSVKLLDAHPGYAIELDDSVLIVKEELERNIIKGCKKFYEKLKCMSREEKKRQLHEVTAIEQRFLDTIDQTPKDSLSQPDGNVYYVPESVVKYHNKTSHRFMGCTDLGLVSVDTGNGRVANTVKEGVGRLQVFATKKLRCYFYTDGFVDCVFYADAGIYVTEDSREICKWVEGLRAMSITMYLGAPDSEYEESVDDILNSDSSD